MENLTQEEIEKSVSAAFDSVNLINELNSKESLNESEIATVERNVEHLKIMMKKEWFEAALTEIQKNQINAIINA